MGGEEVAADWRGLLNVTYRYGPALHPTVSYALFFVFMMKSFDISNDFPISYSCKQKSTYKMMEK